MSAIFGILYLNNDLADEKYLRKMQEIIKHYGTDARDLYYSKEISLGCCLQGIGSNSKEDTPIYYDTAFDCILVGDALIYNREELLNIFEYTQREAVSTQVLLMEAYRRWGEACPKYLNGDFAFAVWENTKKRLLLFRDHLGVRPLYYHYSESVFAFATDYRALLALPFVEKQLDEVMLYAKLRDIYHIDTESTYFAGIKRLPQAYVMQVDAQGISKSKYWSPGKDHKIHFESEEEYAGELYSIVEDSIRLRIEQVQKGICSEFSGGLDSSVITVLAHRELKKIGYEMTAYAWSPAYELLAKQEGDEREFIDTISNREEIQCIFEAFNQSPEEEMKTPPALTDGQRSEGLRHILHKISSQGIKAIISGWGGDEGISHRADLFELLFSKDIGYFLKEAYYQSKGSPVHFMKLLACVPVTLLKRPYGYFGMQNNAIPGIVNPDFEKRMKRRCKKDILYLRINPVKHIEAGASVNRTELTAWLEADEQIQYLFPFLDHRVVDFAMSIPRHLYYKKGFSRYIYRKAFENLLPEGMCYQRGKIDVAREKYWRMTEDLQQKAELVIRLLDKEMFSAYINWETIENLVSKKYFQAATRESIFTLYKLQACYDIQRVQMEAMREGKD